MKQIRDTVGKISSELLAKTPDTQSPIELEHAMQKDYLKELLACCASGKKVVAGDFFLVVLTKKEPLMPNVLRNYFFYRKSCPTPDYDQAVYHYKSKDEEIVLLWVIPSKDACLYLKDHALEVAPEEKELLRYVLKFSDGTLWEVSKKLNKEQKNSPFII
jgi:hypothetical protein